MNKTPENIAQLIIAALVVLGGMVLLHVGIQIDPAGEIHETVLVAFGEAATFAGSIMGIDYHYKNRNKMIQVTLIRQNKKGKAVNGTITFPIGERSFSYPTIENADFIIPAGTYPLNRTWSPKFKKLLPIIEEVPEREGIRIHTGTKPEHSAGCVLVGPMAAANLNIMFNYIEKNTEDEKVQIEIIDSLDSCA